MNRKEIERILNPVVRPNYKEFRNNTGVHFSTNMTAKLDGVPALSTSVKLNPYCQARRNNCKGSICEKCFAEATLNQYSDLEKLLKNNFEILNSKIIPVNEWPIIPAAICRFEAFGDPATETCVINYINCANANKHVSFALWSKNIGILKRVFIDMGYKKPRNLQIIGSSLYPNRPDLRLLEYSFIDRIFTVYTAKYALENDVKINCGIAKCMQCQNCYHKNNIKFINEILKSEQKRYYKDLVEKLKNM